MKKLVAKICCLLALSTIISCVKDRDLTPSGTENMNTNNPTPTPGPTSGNLPLVINEFMAKNTTVVCSDSTLIRPRLVLLTSNLFEKALIKQTGIRHHKRRKNEKYFRIIISFIIFIKIIKHDSYIYRHRWRSFQYHF